MIDVKVIFVQSKETKKNTKMAMVPDIVKNMESYLEEEGTSRKSKQYFRYSYRGFLKIKGLL